MKTKMNQHLFFGRALPPRNRLTWWTPNPHVLEKVALPFFHLYVRFIGCDVDVVLVRRKDGNLFSLKFVTVQTRMKTKVVEKLLVRLYLFIYRGLMFAITIYCSSL